MPIWTALSATVRGTTHERNGLVNQDAVRLKNPGAASDALFLAVADGHGSARSFRSARGSALATDCALRVMRGFLRRLGPYAPLSCVRRQAKVIWPRLMIAAWRQAVRADIAAHPFSFMDFAPFPEPPPVIKPGMDLPINATLAYGATLLTVAITRHYILYSQLGDGDILAVHGDGRVTRPLTRQHEFFANQTLSLCTARAAQEFQVKVEPIRADAPALVMLSTDGYANCFGDDVGFYRVGVDLLTYISRHGAGPVSESLQTWLGESSRDGSGDDITVGLAARVNAVVRTGAPGTPVTEAAEQPVAESTLI